MGAQDFVEEHLSRLDVDAHLSDLYAEAGRRLLMLARPRLLAAASIAQSLNCEAPRCQGGEVKGAPARRVGTDAPGTPLHLLYRNAQGLGDFMLQRLPKLQDTQMCCFGSRDGDAAPPHPRVKGEVRGAHIADDHAVQG